MTLSKVAERLAHPAPDVRATLVHDMHLMATLDLEVELEEERAFAAALLEHIDALVALLADPEWEIRSAVCLAFAELGRAIRSAEPDDDVDHILDLAHQLERFSTRLADTLRDEHSEVRELPSEEARGALVPLAGAGVSPAVRRAALQALIEHADTSCRDVLVASLHDEPTLAAMALARLGTQACIPDLGTRIAAATTSSHVD